MENIREHIYLAALLHDIGKFYQRADSGSVGSSKFLKDEVKNLASILLPVFKGKSTHKHALWSAQFIADYETIFKNLAGAEIHELQDSNNLINITAGHHLPANQQSELGLIIKEADSLASGMDRDSEVALQDDSDEDENNWDAFKRKRMTSILESINLTKEELEKKKEWYHLPVEKLTLNKSYFPAKNFERPPDYAQQWEEFNRDFKFIQATNYRAFSETLLSLLYRYASNIPASTIHFPDVSLYDHSKMAAALAVCLYDWKMDEKKNEKPFLLIGADFSGIQPYIYQVVSKYAGKNLKGRSFYLRILSDAVARFLLKELKLFQSNIIYNSGGSFYILAPNTRFVREKLDQAVRKIEKNMFHSHGTSLYLAIESIEVSKEALMNQDKENLTDLWGNLFVKRDEKKNKKFSYLVSNSYSQFFEPLSIGLETDKITGEAIEKGEATVEIKEIGSVKKLTYQQVELGKRLRESELLIISDGEIQYWKNQNPIQPIDLGFYFYLIKRDEFKKLKNDLKGSADFIHVITLNGKDGNCDFLHTDTQQNETIKGLNNVYGLDFYGGNLFDGKTFDEFCDKESEDVFRRLGVLRMDVDNLGSIFQKGIIRERVTLSRMAALSRSFDYFFTGYINTIQQKIAPDTSFIVYSGGDDLFIVASWEDAIRLAKTIRDEFKDFTCNNPAFSLSGGIAIITPKYPVMKGAKDSDAEEREAKEHKVGEAKKNALSFMNTPLNWNCEFEVVEQAKNRIVSLIKKDDDGNLSLHKSFISKILLHYENADIRKHKISKLKTFWMASYDLGRMASRSKSSEVKNLIDTCKNEICSRNGTLNGEQINTEYHPLELWALAARWAELEIRTNKQSINN